MQTLEETETLEKPELDEKSGFNELVKKLHLLDSPLSILSFSTLGLFIIALFFVLSRAAMVFVPLVAGVMLYFLLRPIMKVLYRMGLPHTIGAGVLLLLLLAVFIAGMLKLSEPARELAADLPRYIERAEFKLRGVKKSVEVINETSEAIEKLAGDEKGSREEIDLGRQSFSDRLYGQTQRFLGSAMVAFILAYFLLASGNLFLRKTVCLLPRFHLRRATVRIFRGIETNLSKYLLSLTIINVILGLCVGTAFYFLEMPNPILWGFLAAILNYVPYIGALLGVVVVLLISIVTYDSLAFAFIPPMIYLALTGLEGSILRPIIIGKWLTLNPVAIFVMLVLWGWVWGAAGALLAIPMLVMFKITCDHIPWLKPVGTILSA